MHIPLGNIFHERSVARDPEIGLVHDDMHSGQFRCADNRTDHWNRDEHSGELD